MEFDTFVMARLLTGPTPPDLSDEQKAELQDAHLAHIADMWASGKLIAAGPASGTDGLRGVSVFVCSVDEARELSESDPAVLNGTYVLDYTTWHTPHAMIVQGDGIPPRSAAEVRG